MNKKLKTSAKVDVLTNEGKISTHITSQIKSVSIYGKNASRAISINGQLDYTKTSDEDFIGFRDTILRSDLTKAQKGVYDAFCDMVNDLHKARKSTTDYNLQEV